MFDWLLGDASRWGVYLAACVVGIFLVAGASLLELFWEAAVSALVALVVAAQYGFFVATLVVALVFVVAYEWNGRKVRVRERSAPGR